MRYLTFFIAISLFIGCAAQRPPETLKDPDGKRLSKEILTGKTVGKHYYANVTVVKTSRTGPMGSFFVGMTKSLKMPVGHFKFTEDQLLFVSDLSPLDNKEETATRNTLFNWSISHHDTAYALRDGNVTNKEIEDPDKKWSEKRYFSTNWAGTTERSLFPIQAAMGNFEGWSKKASYVVEDSFKVTDDYLTFTVGIEYQQNPFYTGSLFRHNQRDYNFTVHFKYMFLKRPEKSDYKPFVYKSEDDADLYRFGYMPTVKLQYNKKEEKYQKILMANRFHPGKTHNFYFSKDFPENLKWMFNDPKKGIFPKTNRIFEKAGLPTRFYVRNNTYGMNKTVA